MLIRKPLKLGGIVQQQDIIKLHTVWETEMKKQWIWLNNNKRCFSQQKWDYKIEVANFTSIFWVAFSCKNEKCYFDLNWLVKYNVNCLTKCIMNLD